MASDITRPGPVNKHLCVKETAENETTDEHSAAWPQPKRISPQSRRGRRGHPWERTRPACPASLTPRTQDACAPRRTQKNILSKQRRIFGLVIQMDTDPVLLTEIFR